MTKSEHKKNKIKGFTILIPFKKSDLSECPNAYDIMLEQAKRAFGHDSHKDHFDLVKKRIRSYIVLKKLIDHSNDQLFTKQVIVPLLTHHINVDDKEISVMRNSITAEYLPEKETEIPTLAQGMTLG